MRLKISSFKRIVVLTGAGISAESGISTFRDSRGLWENHRMEEVATPEAFIENAPRVWRFYSMRRRAAMQAVPNAAHDALAAFSAVSRQNGVDFTLVTQNVDALHERAHAALNPFSTALPRPIAMHGALSHSRCVACGQLFSDPNAWFDGTGSPVSSSFSEFSALAGDLPQIRPEDTVRDTRHIPLTPCCRARLRPHIVWFGEMPLQMNQILACLQRCDLFITIGTSGQVYPASGFLEQAKFAGAATACLNKEPIPQQAMVDFYVEGSATKTVPSVFQHP